MKYPKKNVCLMCGNMSYAGAQTQMLELARNLDKNNFNVRICVFDEKVYVKDEFKQDGIIFDFVTRHSKYDITWVFRLITYLKLKKIDILYTYLPFANFMGLLTGKVAGVSAIISSERNSDYVTSWLFRRIINVVVRYTDNMIANSFSGKNFVTKIVNGTLSKKIHVVYNGRNFVGNSINYKDNLLHQSLNISENTFVVILIARFKPAKNHIMFFKMAKHLLKEKTNVVFLCVGDNDENNREYHKDLMTEFEELQIEHHFKFLGPRHDINELLSGADVSVLTSWHEGLSNTLIESMAVGCPLVVTDVSDNRLIIKDGINGYVVGVDDYKSMAENIIRLYEDKELRYAISRNNKASAHQLFTVERMVNETEKIFYTLCSNKKSAQ